MDLVLTASRAGPTNNEAFWSNYEIEKENDNYDGPFRRKRNPWLNSERKC